jgi:UDP-N-acetylglucosamine transferase subunit ALG13
MVFVTVGTDHHPFDRLIEWIDRWFEDGGLRRARGMVQTGTSRAPRHAGWQPYLTHDQLQEHMRQATCIVCHGGPTTIVDAIGHGKRPIVVPRLKAMGEHVDDHQVAFVRWIETQQDIEVATTEERLRTLLDLAVSVPDSLAATSPPAETSRAIGLIESWIDDLVKRPRPRGRRWPWRRSAHPRAEPGGEDGSA